MESTLPAASIARTAKVWRPRVTRYDLGERQAVQRRRSSLHWNLDAASVAMKRNVARLPRLARPGPERMRVLGATVSRANRAVTVRDPVIVTVHAASSAESQPVQSAKRDGADGVAVSVTTVFSSKVPVQAFPQIETGPGSTPSPEPLPALATTSS